MALGMKNKQELIDKLRSERKQDSIPLFHCKNYNLRQFFYKLTVTRLCLDQSAIEFTI